MLFRELEGIAVAIGKELIRGFIYIVDGSEAMDHVAIGQLMASGDDGLARAAL
jgi:hypothetical protein